jgi:hypothetical protein
MERVLLYAIIDAPALPDCYLNEVYNQTGPIERQNYERKFQLNGVNYENLIQRRYVASDEMHQWIKDNVTADAGKVTSCYAKVRNTGGTNTGSLGPHLDDLRPWVLNYYIDFNENPRPCTEFYINQTGKVYHSPETTDVFADEFAYTDGRLLPTDEPIYGVDGVRQGPRRSQLSYINKEHLTVIGKVEMPKFVWVLLNVRVLHDLVNVTDRRVSLMVDLQNPPREHLDQIEANGVFASRG